MPAKQKDHARRASSTRAPEYDDPSGVATYLSALDHPEKPVVEAIRAAVLRADPKITEGVKWNSVSFYCREWFATINLRPKKPALVVLHRGAKKQPNVETSRTIDDPKGLLQWLSADRAIIPFAGLEDIKAKRAAFVAIIRQWAANQSSS